MIESEITPEIERPYLASVDLSEIFDHIEKNDWEIPEKISPIDSPEQVQRRIDGVFTGFIGYIEKAKEGENEQKQAIDHGIISLRGFIKYYRDLKFEFWNSYYNKGENFWEDMKRVENSLGLYLSPARKEELKKLNIEFEEPSIEDLKFTKDFCDFLFWYPQSEMYQIKKAYEAARKRIANRERGIR